MTTADDVLRDLAEGRADRDPYDDLHVLARRVRELEQANTKLKAALRKRNEPPTDEYLAKLLARSERQRTSRPWRLVGFLVRCIQDERKTRTASLASTVLTALDAAERRTVTLSKGSTS